MRESVGGELITKRVFKVGEFLAVYNNRVRISELQYIFLQDNSQEASRFTITMRLKDGTGVIQNAPTLLKAKNIIKAIDNVLLN